MDHSRNFNCRLFWFEFVGLTAFIIVLSGLFTHHIYCTGSERTRIANFSVFALLTYAMSGLCLCIRCVPAKLCGPDNLFKMIFILVFIGTAATCTVFAVLSILKSCDNEALLISLFATGWLSAFIGGCVFGRILSNVVGYIRA